MGTVLKDKQILCSESGLLLKKKVRKHRGTGIFVMKLGTSKRIITHL